MNVMIDHSKSVIQIAKQHIKLLLIIKNKIYNKIMCYKIYYTAYYSTSRVPLHFFTIFVVCIVHLESQSAMFVISGITQKILAFNIHFTCTSNCTNELMYMEVHKQLFSGGLARCSHMTLPSYFQGANGKWGVGCICPHVSEKGAVTSRLYNGRRALHCVACLSLSQVSKFRGVYRNEE